jgi:hypothetical protein
VVCGCVDIEAVTHRFGSGRRGADHFTEETLELTLDVMRNASNKIAVSLAADAPRVSEGTERYLIDADGQTVFAS